MSSWLQYKLKEKNISTIINPSPEWIFTILFRDLWLKDHDLQDRWTTTKTWIKWNHKTCFFKKKVIWLWDTESHTPTSFWMKRMFWPQLWSIVQLWADKAQCSAPWHKSQFLLQLNILRWRQQLLTSFPPTFKSKDR